MQLFRRMWARLRRLLPDGANVIFTVSAVLIVAFILATMYWTYRQLIVWYPEPGSAAEFGDMFGWVNALFSGLALAGVILAVLFQTHELRLQRRELDETQEMLHLQREEMQRSAEAQEAIVTLSALSEASTSTRDQILDLVDEMRRQLDDAAVPGAAVADLPPHRVVRRFGELITAVQRKLDERPEVQPTLEYQAVEYQQLLVHYDLLSTRQDTVRRALEKRFAHMLVENTRDLPESVQARHGGELVPRIAPHLSLPQNGWGLLCIAPRGSLVLPRAISDPSPGLETRLPPKEKKPAKRLIETDHRI